MTYGEFADLISHTREECLFYVNGKGYWISNNKDGYYLNTEISADPLVWQEFDTGEELIQKARIDGKPLREWWDQIRESFPEDMGI